MKRTISAITAVIFFLSIYCIPSASAITLGEIKPDKKTEDTVKKADESPSDSGKKKAPPVDKKKLKEPEKKDKPPKKIADREEVNPRLVCLLSVLMPGGGHFYLKNDTKGMGFCIAAGIGYTATGFFMVKTMLAETGSAEYKNYMLITGFLFFITLIIHIVGIIEAYTDAEELNKEKLFKDSSDNPLITEFKDK